MKKGWSRFMDRRVKERLIGATILVVLIVLIVPELLSGPKHAVAPLSLAGPAGPTEPVRNVTVDLATSKATPAADDPVPASVPAPAAAPSGAAAATDDAARVASPGTPPSGATPPTITTLQAQQPAAAPLENDAVSPKSNQVTPKLGASREAAPSDGGRRSWAVQLGSFASKVNAEKLERQLKAQSFSAFISASGAGKTLRYRVRVGPMADRATAERVIVRLRKEGHSANAVPL
jgi:DedD protein